MTHFWKLSGIQPDVVLVLLLMLMYDRFFGRIGGRASRPMISRSPILRHLLAVLNASQEFPYFNSKQYNMMLMCHGHVFHVVRTIFGHTTYVNHGMYAMMMKKMMKHMLSHIACNPEIVAGFPRSFPNIMAYPQVSDPPIQMSINIGNLSGFILSSIWDICSLITTLPKPLAILDIKISNLSEESERRDYRTMILFVLLRDLFMEKNPIFLLLCKSIHTNARYNTSIRAEFKNARGSPDFLRCMKYFMHISSMVFPELGDRDPMHQDFDWCLEIIDQIYMNISNMRNDYWHFISMVFRTERVNSVLRLIRGGPTKYFHSHVDTPLCFKLECPPQLEEATIQETRQRLFNVLRTTVKLSVIPVSLLQNLESRINMHMEDDLWKIKSKYVRLFFLLCTFIQLVQSDHPHLAFLFDSFVFVKTHQQTDEFKELQVFFDLGRGQDHSLRLFDKLFQHFCNFAEPSLGFSEKTKRSFIELFDLMMRILADNRFLEDFSKFMTKVAMKLLRSPRIDSLIDKFITHLARQHPEFTHQILPYRRLTCCDCGYYLPLNYDNEMCENCEDHRELRESSDDEHYKSRW